MYGKDEPPCESWLKDRKLRYADDIRMGTLTDRLKLPSPFVPKENVILKSQLVKQKIAENLYLLLIIPKVFLLNI